MKSFTMDWVVSTFSTVVVVVVVGGIMTVAINKCFFFFILIHKSKNQIYFIYISMLD